MKKKEAKKGNGKDDLRGMTFREGLSSAFNRWTKELLKDEVKRIEAERGILVNDDAENR